MKLVIGLGNPGQKYQHTWHNLGFMVVDDIAKSSPDTFSQWRLDKKRKSQVSSGQYEKEKILLAKPETFMNNSGDAVSLLASFYKVKLQDIWIIHDDIDLTLGKIRISKDSSSGGHNGIQSIIDHMHSKDFIQLKIGVGTSKLAKIPADKYVLQNLNFLQKVQIKKTIHLAREAIVYAISNGIDKAMNTYN